MTITIEDEAGKPLTIPFADIIRQVILDSLEAEQCPYEAEINVLLMDDEEIKKINAQYREIDRPTDVLSFPLVDYETPGDFSHLEERAGEFFHPETGELLLGDIIISVDKVREQACAYGHSESRELAFLVAHSMLHLFGYDHMADQERQLMEEKQEKILAIGGYKR